MARVWEGNEPEPDLIKDFKQDAFCGIRAILRYIGTYFFKVGIHSGMESIAEVHRYLPDMVNGYGLFCLRRSASLFSINRAKTSSPSMSCTRPLAISS